MKPSILHRDRGITIRCTRSRGPRGFFCLQVDRRGPVIVAVIRRNKMPKRNKNFRSGDIREAIVLGILRYLGFVAPVPREEDVGVDAIFTLTRVDGMNVRPTETCALQIKPPDVAAIYFSEERLVNLFQLPFPFYFVTRSEKRILVYSTANFCMLRQLAVVDTNDDDAPIWIRFGWESESEEEQLLERSEPIQDVDPPLVERLDAQRLTAYSDDDDGTMQLYRATGIFASEWTGEPPAAPLGRCIGKKPDDPPAMQIQSLGDPILSIDENELEDSDSYSNEVFQIWLRHIELEKKSAEKSKFGILERIVWETNCMPTVDTIALIAPPPTQIPKSNVPRVSLVLNYLEAVFASYETDESHAIKTLTDWLAAQGKYTRISNSQNCNDTSHDSGG